MTTTGQRLVELSSLSTGTAIQHLVAIAAGTGLIASLAGDIDSTGHLTAAQSLAGATTADETAQGTGTPNANIKGKAKPNVTISGKVT